MALPKLYKQAVFKALEENLVLEVKVEACGVCHTDLCAWYNYLGGCFPMVPEYELFGKVVAVGDGVTNWKIGDRFGGGYHGGHDGTCAQC